MAKRSLKSIVYGIKEIYTTATKDAEVITYGNIEPKLEAALNSGSSGGAELNISYGETEPTDTSKLWIKANEPQSIKFSKDIDGVNSLRAIGALNDYNMCCARVGTKIYIFGGSISGGTQIRMFDTETETLTTLSATFSTSVTNAGCASVGSKIYIFGGWRNNSYSDAVSVFDTETEILSTLSVTIPVALEYTRCVTVDNNVYLMGGVDSGSHAAKSYVFDTITETFKSTSVSVNFCKSAVARYGDYIYAFGWYDPRYGDRYNWIYKVDIVSERATKLSTVLPVNNAGMDCAIIGNMIYLIGGDWSADVYVFDVLTETITKLDITLPDKAGDSCCCAVGNNIYSFGGNNLKSVRKFSVTHQLENGDIEVITAPQNFFKLINTSAADVEIGVDRVLIGNSSNEAENCEAYLYKNATWSLI